MKVQRANKRVKRGDRVYEYATYFVYVPRAYEKYVAGREWIVTIVAGDERYPIGLRGLSRHNKHYIITLPNDLAYYWEKVVGKEVDVVLQRP